MAEHAHTTPVSGPHPTHSGSPQKPPKRLTAPQRRKVLESALDGLLAVVDGILADLDALDGDADAEPSLGAPEWHPPVPRSDGCLQLTVPDYTTQLRWAAGGSDEREYQCEGEGDYDEREPEEGHCVPTYAGDIDGSLDQRQVVSYLNR